MPSTGFRFSDFWYITPEMVLTAWGLLVLIVDFAGLRHRPSGERQRILGGLSLAGVVVTLLAMLLPSFAEGMGYGFASRLGIDVSETDPYLFYGTIASDLMTQWFNVLVTVLLGLVVGMSMAWRFTEHWGEYFALLFWAAVGMMLLIASEDLLTLFLTLETMTLCLYLATSFETSRRRSAEAGLKYFVYGSVSSALFLFGLSLIYGFTGTTRFDAIESLLLPHAGRSTGLLVQVSSAGTAQPATVFQGNVAGATAILLLLVGFGFKVAAVPFHQWAPDAYEGAPAPVTAWIASGSKVASFVAMMKVLVHALGPWARDPKSVLGPGWVAVVAVIAAVTMTYGNFAALAQRNLKRMLAYSSIAHAGYMLVGVLAAAISVKHGVAYSWNPEAAGAVLFYLVTYSIATVGAFSLAAWLSRDTGREEIDDLNGLGFRSPFLAVCIVLLMLSLIGVPPLAGFVGKVYMFMEALNSGQTGWWGPALVWLVGLGLLNSVVSAFYYVRVMKAVFMRAPERSPLQPASASIAWPIVIATLVVLAFGIYPDMLLDPMRKAAVPMLTPSASSSTAFLEGSRAARGTAPMPGPRISDEDYQRQMQEMSKRIMGAGNPGGGPPPAMGAPGAGAPRGGGRPPAAGKRGGPGAFRKGGTPKKGAPRNGAATKDATPKS